MSTAFKEFAVPDKAASRVSERGGPVTLLPDPAQREIWCPIISVDDHVLEPPDLFTSRLPTALRDKAPHVEYDDEGVPEWIVGDYRQYLRMSAVGAVGRPISEWSMAPQRYEELRSGTWDTSARVADMDIAGIWASLGFASFIFGFAGRRLSLMADRDLALACVRAYNDWMLEEWCGSHPDRFVPCQLAFLPDPDVAAREIRANAERGFTSVSLPENPEQLGLPDIYSEHWNPLLAACEDTGTVINLHVGSAGVVQRPCASSPSEVIVTLFPVSAMMGAADWIFSKLLIRYPRLQIVMSEGGVSWVPMMIERLTRSYRQAEASLYWRPSDPDPVELLHRNFWFTSIEDPAAFELIGKIGSDKVMVEADYPHADSSWPDTQELLRRDLSGLDVATVRKVCYETAAQLYRHPAPPADRLAASVVGA